MKFKLNIKLSSRRVKYHLIFFSFSCVLYEIAIIKIPLKNAYLMSLNKFGVNDGMKGTH